MHKVRIFALWGMEDMGLVWTGGRVGLCFCLYQMFTFVKLGNVVSVAAGVLPFLFGAVASSRTPTQPFSPCLFGHPSGPYPDWSALSSVCDPSCRAYLGSDCS